MLNRSLPSRAITLPKQHLLPLPHGFLQRPCSRKHIRSTEVFVFDKLKGLFSSSDDSGRHDGDDEGAEMVRIDPDSKGGLGGTSDQVFGPLAVLLVGFLESDYEAFRAMMNDMEADMVKVVPATRAIMSGTLQQAVETEFPRFEQPPLGQRRAIILSGMYGSEVTEVIAAYRDAGLPPCAFAAAVPNNFQRNVQELVDAVWKDQAALMSKLQEQQQGRGLKANEDSY